MQTLRRSNGVSQSKHGCKSVNSHFGREYSGIVCRGSASFCDQKKQVLVDNLRDGYDLYRFERRYPTHSFKVPTQPFAIAKQVVFAEESTLAVGGSDNGLVHVFRIASGEEVQTLKHGEGMIFDNKWSYKLLSLTNQRFHRSASCGGQGNNESKEHQDLTRLLTDIYL